MSERRAPVQGWYAKDGRVTLGPYGTVPWALHVETWEFYATVYGREQSAERMAERGGFGYREMQCLLAKMRDHDNTTPLPDLPGWEPLP